MHFLSRSASVINLASLNVNFCGYMAVANKIKDHECLQMYTTV